MYDSSLLLVLLHDLVIRLHFFDRNRNGLLDLLDDDSYSADLQCLGYKLDLTMLLQFLLDILYSFLDIDELLAFDEDCVYLLDHLYII
jgi:hypothetical protein